MSRSRPHIFAAAILILALLIALCILAPSMYPLHTDTSANFWYAATHVDLGATRQRDDVIIVDRDRLIYSSQSLFAEYYDFPYEMISLDTAAHDFLTVQKELAKRAMLNNPDDFYAKGYSRWESRDRHLFGPVPDTYEIQHLLLCIDQARTEYMAATYSGLAVSYYRSFQTGLHVAKASRLYWATFVFEACLFTLLILFAFWPYIHRATLRRKLTHIALLPFLLYLPAWFGYCNSASLSFPVGGILYPYVNCPLWTIFNNRLWEFDLLAKLPPIFSVITQGRTVNFNEYVDVHYSVPYQFGPINVAAISVLLTLLFACFHTCAWLYQQREKSRRGFPVLESNTPSPPA